MIIFLLVPIFTIRSNKDSTMENIRTASIDAIQKMQIDELLKQADQYIRSGRYVAADELLQKIFSINPQNTTAHAYQDRIQFLVKQLSQRVGLDNEMYKEIKRYRDLLSKRKLTQISNLLSSAQQFINDGNFKKASEHINKALGLDPENTYANALKQRLVDIQYKPGISVEQTEREFKLCSLIRESWKEGKPSDEKMNIVRKMQNEFNISEGKRLELEREAKNILYKEALKEIWLTGGLSAFTPELIDSLRKKFEVSRVDRSAIEAELLRELRKNKIRGTILVIEEDDKTLLEISSHLRMHFFAVIAAGNLEEVNSSLKIAIPDFILSEINFQSGTLGFELYEFVRSTPKTMHVPFLFMSDKIDRNTILVGKRLGVDEFLIKPLDYELLIEILNGKLRFKTTKKN